MTYRNRSSLRTTTTLVPSGIGSPVSLCAAQRSPLISTSPISVELSMGSVTFPRSPTSSSPGGAGGGGGGGFLGGGGCFGGGATVVVCVLVFVSVFVSVTVFGFGFGLGFGSG